ncbi:MAG: hypothetical protein BWY14_01231 [Parcubacteria group bacterium ADurb.Bin192]|nr:MAG: hypothetical protein BWY14_01231 [Parcubacteria group bacterium ADurb.Bin192]
MEDSILFYVLIAATAIVGIAFVALLVWRLFLKENTVVVSSSDTDREAADEGKKAAAAVTSVTETVASNVAKAELEHEAVINEIKATTETKKAEIQNADTDKLKSFLTKEGYNVTEIFPEN